MFEWAGCVQAFNGDETEWDVGKSRASRDEMGRERRRRDEGGRERDRGKETGNLGEKSGNGYEWERAEEKKQEGNVLRQGSDEGRREERK